MNYLAHVYLSGNNREILVGNFIADAVKGKAMDQYVGDIREGIILHRAIDEFTDNHEIHKSSRKRLHSRYGHYAGVMIDIYYDHFLAANWPRYSDRNLAEYTSEVYQILKDHWEILPGKIRYMLGYMIPQNWLLNYGNLEGVDRVFNGLAKRTKFESGMESGVASLQAEYEFFKSDFMTFFPELKEFVIERMQTSL